MSRVVIVSGKKIGTNEKVIGTGFNVIDGHTYIFNKDERYEIDKDTLLIRGLPEMEKYSNHNVDEDDMQVLLERLVQTAIDVCKDRGLDVIDEISFGVDGLKDSIEFGGWTPSTDASLKIIGRHEGKRKIIGEKF